MAKARDVGTMTPARIRTITEAIFVITVLVSFTAPYWSAPFDPRVGAFISALAFAIFALIALLCLVTVARGHLEYVDLTAVRLGQRLGRPRVVAGAELWAWLLFVVYSAWTLADKLVPGGIEPGSGPITPIFTDYRYFLAFVGIAVAPLLLLYIVDRIRQAGQRSFVA